MAGMHTVHGTDGTVDEDGEEWKKRESDGFPLSIWTLCLLYLQHRPLSGEDEDLFLDEDEIG